MQLTIPYHKTSLPLRIPKTHHVDIILPHDEPVLTDPDTLIRNALENPVASPHLGDIIQPGNTISIIVSDSTRTTPTNIMLPPLLDMLLCADAQEQNITIIYALGIHRRQSEQEQVAIVGQDIYQKYQCIDHDKDRCQYIGTTSRGTRVEVFDQVVRSDVIICTGSIEYHYFAGYTGGYKAILPGVSSYRSIMANHGLMIRDGTSPGNYNCPVRSDMEEAGSIFGVDFILNVVLNSKKQITGAAAGHPVHAHRVGTQIVDGMYKQSIEPADIVIVSPGGWPKDIDLFQSHKALEHVKSVIRPGGSVILVAHCLEGTGNEVFDKWMNMGYLPEEIISRLEQEFILGGHKAALLAKLALEFDMYLVSGLTQKTAKKAYFNGGLSLQQAFDKVSDKYRPDARVVVVPYGTSTLVEKENRAKQLP
jgi:nickel-dependent lactate racemase